MTHVLKIFLSLSLSGSLLILILFLSKPLLKNNMSKGWQYYVWFIVIARLLLPFAPETNLIGTAFRSLEHTITNINKVPISQINNSDLKYKDISISNSSNNDHNTSDSPTVPSNNQLYKKILTMLINNLCLLWIVTALILFIRKITIYQSFVRFIKAGQSPVVDTKYLDRLATVGVQIGVKRPVELFINPIISSPLLIGFLHPCIILPSAEISQVDFQYTILHELTHYRRGDIFCKWLVQITICLHWYNPLVYLMGREIDKACELSCDEAIIKKLNTSEARTYGNTLLNAMASVGKYKENLASVTLSSNKQLLKERLGAIMSYKKKTGFHTIISIILALSMCFAATTVGAYGVTKQPNSPERNKEDIPNSQSIQTTELNKQKLLQAPASIDSCKIKFEDTPYAWPYISYKISNNSNKIISKTQIVLLAYNKKGIPIKLYWDARNVDESGGHGNTGYGDGVDYGKVVGIYPYSPKSYDWQIDTQSKISPNKSITETGWSLFDGWWDQPKRTHKVKFLLSCIKEVTYSDGTVWKNPEYKNWLNKYKNKTVSLNTLKSYYN